jgi:phosphate acyltransferase
VTGPVRVALDLLGGDGAPDVVVDGALLAIDELPGVAVVLVGPPAIAAELLGARGREGAVEVVAATESVGMAEDPVRAVRAKRDATVRVAARLVRDGTADALVSAGSTGAAVVAAVFTLGRLAGVTRPSLAVNVPAAAGTVVLTDGGANPDCSVDMLAQFALCASAYAQVGLGVAEPRVGLLSNGSEPGKGDELRREAHLLLEQLPLRFVGNVESMAVTTGADVDVVVTDGFTGNVLLKGIEGMQALLRHRLRDRLDTPAAALAAVDELAPERHSGAIVLGVRGVVVLGHGASNARAVASCVRLAAQAARADLVSRLETVMGDLAARRLAAGLTVPAPQQG